MYKNVCISNRQIAGAQFMERMREASGKADLIILREKDLPQDDYEALAKEVLANCRDAKARVILHTFKDVARTLNYPYIHLTMKDFLALTADEKAFFKVIGVSTHSVEEAVLAEKEGAAYVTASHIFETECKEGLAPRGLTYLENTCKSVTIPVYALGGIHPDNIELCISRGAAGVCMMSAYMKGEV